MKEGIEIGVEQGMKQKELEIANKSLQKGLDTQTIMMITTLNKEEIEGLRVQCRLEDDGL
jgi:predicted transposase YdaD